MSGADGKSSLPESRLSAGSMALRSSGILMERASTAVSSWSGLGCSLSVAHVRMDERESWRASASELHLPVIAGAKPCCSDGAELTRRFQAVPCCLDGAELTRRFGWSGADLVVPGCSWKLFLFPCYFEYT